MYIYILKLKDNKYYIGKTTNPKFRITNHCNKQGSKWTSKYNPVKLIELIPDCDNYDEDKYTLLYMKKYGIDNVRGGSFCKIKLSDETKEVINNMILSSSDKCFTCGEEGHFSNNCKYKLVWSCEYCNKEFKTKKGCLYHQNVYCEEKKLYYDSNSEEEYECKYCGKEFKTKKGCSYHENVYCKEKNLDYDSNSEEEYEYSYYNKKSNNCYRCGRKGHYSSNCYANKHIKGYYLS